MNIALIGTTKIAYVHLRILNNIKIKKKIYIISRSLERSKNFIIKSNLNKFRDIIPSNIDILKKKKFELIDICVATDVHHKFLEKLATSNAVIFIEKPLINPNMVKSNLTNYLNKIYLRHKKLVVCYPFLNLSQSINKILLKKKGIKSLSFYFFTSGNKNYENILYDLLPHAYPFISKLMNLKKIYIDKKSINKKSKKHSYILKFITQNGKNISIYFRQNIKFKKSILKFKINNETLERKTKIENNNFINFIRIKGKNYNIPNPMDEFIHKMYKNKKNNKYFKKNKKLTYDIYNFQSQIEN